MYYAAQDVMEYLMASTGGGAQDSEHRMLRAAVHNAYRDVAHAKDWLWYVTDSALTNAAGGSGDGIKTFTLPENVNNVDALIPPDRIAVTSYITPAEWKRLEAWALSASDPIYWTVMKDPSMADRWQLRIAGTPQAGTFYFTYRRKPQPLRYMGYETACRNNSLTSSSAPGAVKRYGTAANFPESLFGIYPFLAQERLGLSGSMIGSPPSGAKTVVSDYLDVSENMYTAVLSGAEMWLARLMGKNVEGAMGVYQRDLRMAMEADVVAPISGRRTGTDRHPDMPSPAYAGTARTMGYYSQSGPDTGG
jgi:hypothetical protein